jgi:hypothetical protein
MRVADRSFRSDASTCDPPRTIITAQPTTHRVVALPIPAIRSLPSSHLTCATTFPSPAAYRKWPTSQAICPGKTPGISNLCDDRARDSGEASFCMEITEVRRSGQLSRTSGSLWYSRQSLSCAKHRGTTSGRVKRKIRKNADPIQVRDRRVGKGPPTMPNGISPEGWRGVCASSATAEEGARRATCAGGSIPSSHH